MIQIKKRLIQFELIIAFGLIFMPNVIQAQSLKTYSGEKKVDIKAHSARDLNCKETYQYYIGEKESYVKSGSYSLSGRTDFDSFGAGDGAVTESYSVTATFKDGYLNGKLTAKMSVKGYMYFYSVDPYEYNVEVTLTGGFKNGVPDGLWVYTERGDINYNEDNIIFKSTFNCKDGKFVGAFDINFANEYLMSVTRQKGQFNQNGQLLSVTMRGRKNTDRGVKEYKFSPSGCLLSYVHRDENNQTIGIFKADENLAQNSDKEQWIAAMKENGYVYWVDGKSFNTHLQYECDYSQEHQSGSYGNDCYGSYFSTNGIVDYILDALQLEKNVGGIKDSDGLFGKYNISICKSAKKWPVKALSDNQLQQLAENQKADFFNSEEFMLYDSKLQDREDIVKLNDVYFLKATDTLYYFSDTQLEQYDAYCQNAKAKNVEDNKWQLVRKKAESELSYSTSSYALSRDGIEADEIISKEVDSVWMSSDSLFHCRIIVDYRTEKETEKNFGWKSIKKECTYKIKNRGVYVNRFTGRAGDDYVLSCVSDGAYVEVPNVWDELNVLDKQIRQKGSGHNSILRNYDKAQALNYSLSKDKTAVQKLKQAQAFVDFQHQYLEYVGPIMNMENALLTNSDYLLSFSQKENDIRDFYYNYSMKWNMDDIFVINSSTRIQDLAEQIPAHIAKLEEMASFQNYCKDFIVKRRMISEKNAEIVTKATAVSPDISTAFATFTQTQNIAPSADTNDNNTRIKNFIAMQDSCLAFIELRKNIDQNNEKIATYAKTASHILKVYTPYMQQVDLSWNQKASRNQELREIIYTQNKLVAVLEQENIREIDKSVRKSDDQSWENVKKIVLSAYLAE